MDVALLTMDDNNKPPTSSESTESRETSPPMMPDSAEIMRLLTDPSTAQMFANENTKCQLGRILAASGFDEASLSSSFPFDPTLGAFADISQFSSLRNSSKTLKCPKCNWHYKYQETLEIHMKEKHNDVDVKCMFCAENRPHPKLARGETYSCGYKPYRCDLCRYSTTTKGNLSIHMQSDKHLHAVQELPNSIEFAANFACGAPVSRSSPIEESDGSLVCLICGIFATESIAEMMEHVEQDRSRTFQGDVTVLNGSFRCHLCPYNTTLKANFQLHTRTDKHLQKVQIANHLREGTRPHTAIYRLSSTKTSVQVLCRQCQEVISSGESLREHRHFHALLAAKQRLWRCKLCRLEFDSVLLAAGHMTCHEPSTWPNESLDFKTMEDAAYACAGCEFTTKDVSDFEEHAKGHEEEAGASSQKACALCLEPTDDLEKHLVEQHRIAESAIEKFLLTERTAKEASCSSSSEPSSEFAHRCSRCSMAFRSESQLQTHSLQHVFNTFHKCPTCGDSFDENTIVTHMLEHTKEECEMCSETFATKEAFLSHLNSARHLQQAKKQLENSLVDLNSQDVEKQRIYVCNVCKQSYPQAANLDVHMRSMTHQSRMSRLSELVATGELNGEKAVFEQPGIPAPTINSFIETTTNQSSLNDLMSLLTRSESDEIREEVNGLQVMTQIKVYGESKITSLVPELAGKIDNIALFDDSRAAEVSKIDCSACGQQISGILALNLHYEESHSSKIPSDVLRKFGERLLAALEDGLSRENSVKNGSQSPLSNDDEPMEKKMRLENMLPEMDKNAAASQFAMFQQMMNCFPFMAPPGTSSGNFGFSPEMINQLMNPAAAAAAATAAAAAHAANNSPAKRARTRITDDQLKVLRQYFNINNSPSEAQIKEMSQKASLPEKVIKHWFRNTLFKERQRDKDSPYNFSIPPQMGIDLDIYEKTGETKVLSLSNEAPKSELSSARATPTIPTPIPLIVEEKKPEPKSQTPSSSSSQLNLQAMLSQMQGSFFDASNFMSASVNPMTPSTPSCNTSSSGRRANRTRFTDFQLRTLQQFFDKQAYPKDDDLEALSKKLQLSPRVIVVWFQNARQKARKIYENQPNHESSDRFVRTPGSNFQCKRCSQVFQRYYELIQHQQKKCYKDDVAALASDNKSVEESLTEEEKSQLLAQQQVAQLASTLELPKFQPAELLKMIGANSVTPSSSAASQKSSNDVLLKMCESIVGGSTPSTSSFHKLCIFCAQDFKDRSAMSEHMAQKHPQHMLLPNFDLDMMPDAGGAELLMDLKDSALDLSGSSVDYRDSISTSPSRSEDDVLTEALDDSAFAAFGLQLANSTSGSECRSPASNKRFRTHLTPMQVQMMKSVFNEYKTPSMAECELLGKEVGLHKRVVQVWFQNARAKERKTRGAVDEDSRSGELHCEICDKTFATRLSLQDHLFAEQHIEFLRNNLKREGVSELTTASVTECSPEKKAKLPNPLDLASFPFLNTFDIQIYGTPIAFLQVPDEIKKQITDDITAGKSRTTFSQDGFPLDKLKESLPEDEKSNLTVTQKDVGWACPACTFVFQEEKKLREHQKAMCQSDKTLTLVQTHYSCKSCQSDFCLQSEYQFHLSMPPHTTTTTTTTP
ncbi:Zinc Finger and Homeobox [Caenorhabditis elegans]|uniref:Zinc Finger and Homeobox n=6 Tax=Caenorhabditis elegans TaxID=6239 RepID=V6CLN5_CAEEL|nr:Zinc Finger and Homeobox [Caenorhabditis elegans]CDK13519.1 Zinc Finger and Homeobox [Caenorhabditis elegans]|eukprot:NP_001293233.1 Zinc Finger and Homeobox [Caenorhabditis elegans]